MKKIIKGAGNIGKGLVKGTFSPLGLTSIGIETDLFHNSVADGTMDGHYKRQRKILFDKLPKDQQKKLKKLKTFKEFQEEMMGGGAIVNNVGDGKIAGTVEAGDDPPKKKKKRYVYGGKGSRKMWM